MNLAFKKVMKLCLSFAVFLLLKGLLEKIKKLKEK